jgi:L-amino acid N-acyltransferase YncA
LTPKFKFNIELMRAADGEAVREIYLQGISTGNATFETTAPEWDAWDSAHLPSCRLVAREDKRADAHILGWAALSPVSKRNVYAGVAEVSLYIAEDSRGQGIGKALLSALIERSEAEGIWTLQAGIFSENTLSIGLHRSLGFRVVGTRERIGKLQGRWRDVVLMERRNGIL